MMERNNSPEDYLESILALNKKNGYARSVDIAKELGVSKPSVCNAMKRLRYKEMISIGDKGHIILTDTGRTVAESVYRKRALLTKILKEIGVKDEVASEEASGIGHVISDDTYECLNAFFRAHLITAD